MIHPGGLGRGSWFGGCGRSGRGDGDGIGGVGNVSDVDNGGDNYGLMSRESGDLCDGWLHSTDVPAGLWKVWTKAFGSAGFAVTVPDQFLGARLADGPVTIALEKPGRSGGGVGTNLRGTVI